ncbi:unnamed protein product [Rotaria sp. Silwood1]|nr:unnamed protein product [Rotaria sp. Silwood1]
MASKENKSSKKNRTGYLTSSTNISAANHLSYLFQTAHTVLLTTADFNLVRHLIKQIHKHKTGIIVSCLTCNHSRFYPKHNSWPIEHGAHIPSDWLFNNNISSLEK